MYLLSAKKVLFTNSFVSVNSLQTAAQVYSACMLAIFLGKSNKLCRYYVSGIEPCFRLRGQVKRWCDLFILLFTNSFQCIYRPLKVWLFTNQFVSSNSTKSYTIKHRVHVYDARVSFLKKAINYSCKPCLKFRG